MKRPKPVALLSIALLTILIISWIGLTRKKVVVVIVNGDVQGITTKAISVKGALEESDIFINPGDEVDPPLRKWISNKEIINVTRASRITISHVDSAFTTRSTERNLASLLASTNLLLDDKSVLLVNGKEYSLEDDIPFSHYQQIEVRPATKVQISVNQNPKTLTSASLSLAHSLWREGIPLVSGQIDSQNAHHPPSPHSDLAIQDVSKVQIKTSYREFTSIIFTAKIGHALAQAGTPLQLLDSVTPEENEQLPDNATLEITNVAEKISLDQQIINFATERQPLPDLEIDNQTLVQAGEYGLEAQRIRIRYENGEEVSRQVEDTWTARQPLPRIEGYGTNIVIRTTNTEHGTIEYWRALEFYATSYSAARAGVSPDKSWYGHVYCGGLLKKGYVAVDLNYIPCGTQMYIPGYGYATAMDTGSISGAWIDLGYDDNNYVAWHQNVTVYFLTPVPAPDSIAYTIPAGSVK